MFEYTVKTNADNEAFKKACAKIEEHIKPIKKDKLLIDVDGSLVQTYHTSKDEIDVFNDYDVDAVYIESSVNLNELFA